VQNALNTVFLLMSHVALNIMYSIISVVMHAVYAYRYAKTKQSIGLILWGNEKNSYL